MAAGLGLLVILLANLTTNVAANLVSPSYDFSNLAPSKISFRTGGLIAAVIGLLFMPWKLLATSGGYLFTWLGGYGTLLGAIAGILLVDYYLTTNVAANLVSPSYDFSQVAPSKISFRMGGLIAALIGLVFMPWKLLATSGGYLFTWLGGYGTLLGAIAGILLVDYYLVRKSELKVDDLYRRGGEYEYSNGWNLQALIAFALGVLPCLPGYLAVSGVVDKAGMPAIWLSLFDSGWFFSLAVAGTYYYLTAKKK